MNIIEVRDMELTIELNGIHTSIIGPTNSGKTILAKKLCNKVDNKDVYIDGKNIREYPIKELRESIAVVLDDNHFYCETVSEELVYYQNLLNINNSLIQERLTEISKSFKIEHLLNKRIDTLYLCDKTLIKILSLLIIEPKIFIVDNLLSYLKEDTRNILFKLIKNKKISFINLTTNSEHLLKSDNVIVLNNFKSVISGTPKSILEGNSILPYMGIKLPFIVDLSHNLILYNVIDKIYSDNRKLVEELWK